MSVKRLVDERDCFAMLEKPTIIGASLRGHDG